MRMQALFQGKESVYTLPGSPSHGLYTVQRKRGYMRRGLGNYIEKNRQQKDGRH